MDNGLFEGYIGLRLAGGSYLDDVIPVILLIEISLFAIIFHFHAALIWKMAKDLLSVKERDNLFDRPVRSDLFFRTFMKFQVLSLNALFLYLLAGRYTDLPSPQLPTTCSSASSTSSTDTLSTPANATSCGIIATKPSPVFGGARFTCLPFGFSSTAAITYTPWPPSLCSTPSTVYC